MKKFISLFLVFSILHISCATISSNNAETKIDPKKKGAALIVLKKEGQSVRGELIAVKENSLVLLERELGGDVTIDIGDISVITILKRSKFLKGAGLGALIGASAAALLGISAVADGNWDEDSLAIFGFIALVFAGTGALIGGIVGVASNDYITIPLEGKSDSEIQKILEKLRKKARVKNSQ